jgi:hypothetical protein
LTEKWGGIPLSATEEKTLAPLLDAIDRHIRQPTQHADDLPLTAPE